MTIASITVRFNGDEIMGYYCKKDLLSPGVFQFIMGRQLKEFKTLQEALDYWAEIH